MSVLKTAVMTGLAAGVGTGLDVPLSGDAGVENVTTDIVGFGAQELLQTGIKEAAVDMLGDAAAGPVGIALMVIQAASMLVDVFWNPFANLYQADLDAMKTRYKNAYVQNLVLKAGMSWPLEYKPALVPRDKDGNTTPEFQQKLHDFLKQYYQDNGLISEAQEIQLVKITDALLNRQVSMAAYNPMLNLFSDPKKTMVSINMLSDMQLVRLMGTALLKRQGKAVANLPQSVQNDLTAFNQRVAQEKAEAQKDLYLHIGLLIGGVVSFIVLIVVIIIFLKQ